MSDDSSSVFELRMKDAAASKQVGNAALAAGNVKSASFHYKKVYLYLAEYLPADFAGRTLASANTTTFATPSGKYGDDNDASNGLVGFLQQRRQKQQQQQQPSTATDKTEQRESNKGLSDADTARLYELYGSTLNNLTLVDFKLGRFKEGVAAATCLLDRVPGFEVSPKSLLRRAHCHLGLQDAAAAEVDAGELERVVGLAAQRLEAALPEEKEARAAEVLEGFAGMTVAGVAAMATDVAALKAAIQQSKKTGAEKEKKMFQKMFSA